MKKIERNKFFKIFLISFEIKKFEEKKNKIKDSKAPIIKLKILNNIRYVIIALAIK